MTKVLVTGANGQLGRCIKDAASEYPQMQFSFVTRKELDISNKATIEEFFRKHQFDYCINTAAYTNVEKAESEADAAFQVNAEGVKYLSETCKRNNTVLLHISTDYVFDGEKKDPYLETDITNPINVYGASKLKGEEYIQSIWDKHFIFRTSWLYSQYGHNFLNTILKYSNEGKQLTITTEQTGTPTNANDLADALLQVISQDIKTYGIYHFSNKGEATWYDFAEKILYYSDLEKTNLGKTNHYRTFARRPMYSVMDNSKRNMNLRVKNINWSKSLESLIKNKVNNL